MSFSYASSNAPSSGLSWVRMRVADTSSVNAKLTDEEITALLDVFGSKYLAAAAAAEQIGASFAGRSDKTVGKLSLSQGSAGQRYFELARRLRYESALFASPYAGGISADDKATDRQDSDNVRPAFESGQFEDVAQFVDGSSAI